VRGDSLRDLYAKALALLGLGLLGAAGALVDYWPVRGGLPVVASALVLPASFGVPGLRGTALPDVSSSTERRATAAKSLASAVADEALATPDPNANDAVFGPPDGQAESLEPAAVLPPSLDVAPASMAAMPASTLALIPPVITAFEAIPENPLFPQPAPAVQQNRDNRLAGAAKTSARVVAWPFMAVASKIGHFLHL
jgi:hypothetical protein